MSGRGSPATMKGQMDIPGWVIREFGLYIRHKKDLSHRTGDTGFPTSRLNFSRPEICPSGAVVIRRLYSTCSSRH
jgi:hypothetical protein